MRTASTTSYSSRQLRRDRSKWCSPEIKDVSAVFLRSRANTTQHNPGRCHMVVSAVDSHKFAHPESTQRTIAWDFFHACCSLVWRSLSPPNVSKYNALSSLCLMAMYHNFTARGSVSRLLCRLHCLRSLSSCKYSIMIFWCIYDLLVTFLLFFLYMQTKQGNVSQWRREPLHVSESPSVPLSQAFVSEGSQSVLLLCGEKHRRC